MPKKKDDGVNWPTSAQRTGSHWKVPDGSVWPCPKRAGEIGWRMRYGTPTREDMLVAASVMSAYATRRAYPAAIDRAIRKESR